LPLSMDPNSSCFLCIVKPVSGGWPQLISNPRTPEKPSLASTNLT
jgi:hypothetical protein